MSTAIKIQPLTSEAFAPFGDVIDTQGAPDKIINQGKCGRFHDCAKLAFSSGKAGLSIFKAEARSLPLSLDMMERHPLGSQAFIPMTMDAFLVIVAHDKDGEPSPPLAFKTAPGQAVNFHINTWHGVLTPLAEPGLFAVVDRIGEETNLEEYWFKTPYKVTE